MGSGLRLQGFGWSSGLLVGVQGFGVTVRATTIKILAATFIAAHIVVTTIWAAMKVTVRILGFFMKDAQGFMKDSADASWVQSPA